MGRLYYQLLDALEWEGVSRSEFEALVEESRDNVSMLITPPSQLDYSDIVAEFENYNLEPRRP